jgi:polyphosphate kinase
MPRNLDHRVESVTEVLDPALKERLDELLRVNLEDDVLAWELRPDGWAQVDGARRSESHLVFQRLAEERAVP